MLRHLICSQTTDAQRHGLTKVTDTFPSSTNLTVKNATLAPEHALPPPMVLIRSGASASESAKIFDFFAVFASFAIQGFLSDINLVKPCFKSQVLIIYEGSTKDLRRKCEGSAYRKKVHDGHCDWHGFTKVAVASPTSAKLNAKNAKCAKTFDFLCGARGFSGSKFLSDINLKTIGTRAYALAKFD
jgi:hypothetical protein